ncbi:LPD7 domain-containing protein [Sphingomonas baiyangensis]|uniref:LPD7 domain-containing protein n=1 Tax=Sphingomonas baiyangensis TaxID=2572576 RepID=UPI003743C92E
MRGRAPAFVERNDRIWINDRADDAVRAALIVAQARYGVVAAHGDPAFVAQARRLGRELGIEVQKGVTITTAQPARERSPRIRQRRETVRRWNAAAGHPQKVPAVASTATEHGQPVEGAPAVSGHASANPLPERQRRAILARVARLLADDDWDPRDYRHGVRQDEQLGGERRRQGIERVQSSARVHHPGTAAAGRGR